MLNKCAYKIPLIRWCTRFKGGHPDFNCVVKLYLKIAFDQQTRARDRTLSGFWTPGAHRCSRDSRAHILSIFGSILPNHLNMLKPMLWSATTLLSTQGCRKRGGRGTWPPIKSGQGAKKGHIFWPYLAYPLLTNISWYYCFRTE